MNYRNIIFTIFFYTLISPIFVQAEPGGYLRKGTYALNPENQHDIFLYIPRKTLLYSIDSEIIKIGSKAFPNLRRKYIKATTQDGIDVLVWKDEVKTDASILNKFDFIVNRRLPLCLTLESCESIWSEFNRVSDEGDGWIAIWPGAGGKLFESTGGVQKVKIDASGWEEGFIPLKRGRLTIEDYGYITSLKRIYPLYRFSRQEINGLNTKCGETITNEKKKEIYTKVEAYGKLSADISVDPLSGLPTVIPKKYVKLLLDSLGLKASISANAFLDGKWKTEDTSTEGSFNIYGQNNESWRVFDIIIEKRGLSDLGTDSDYKPYGRILAKKVFVCQGSESAKLKYTSFSLSFYDEKGHILDDSSIPIAIDENIVKEDIGISRTPKNRALVSVASMSDHFKLVDYFLKQGIPKSISNYMIKEINLSKSQR